MPSGEWYINGELVPTHLVARRDPDYVPFQSVGLSLSLQLVEVELLTGI